MLSMKRKRGDGLSNHHSRHEDGMRDSTRMSPLIAMVVAMMSEKEEKSRADQSPGVPPGMFPAGSATSCCSILGRPAQITSDCLAGWES
jgi:hypothetical protein